MFTIKKIWDALNYAGKPWQISLAISFGLIVGLTPFVSLHNIIILILALILNIHLGTFILFSGIFGGIAYIFDPFFHSLGLGLLTNESLSSLWTAFYNNPILNISQFNNTIMAGSMTVSLILFLPLFFVSNILLFKYRQTVALKFQNIPLFNKISFSNENKAGSSIFRIWGIALIAILSVPFILISGLYLDSFVKERLETNLSKQTNKDVAINSVNVGLLSSSISIKGITVSDKKDPQKNIAVDTVTVDIDILNLIRQKFIIENLTIENIHFPNHVVKKEVLKKDDTVKEDSSKFDITQLAKIDISSIQNIQTSKVQEYYNIFKDYYKKIKPLFNQEQTSQEEKSVYRRGVGSFIKFEDNTDIPNLLIKEAIFSINYENIIYKGDFVDFTTNQEKYKKPFKLNVSSSNEKVKELKLNASILQTKADEFTKIDLNAVEFKANDFANSDFSLFNTLLNADLNIHIGKNNRIVTNGKADILNTDIILKESNKYVKELNKTLKNTKGINATLNIQGDMEKPKTAIKSNIDKILKEKINEVIKSQKENIKKEIESKAKDKLQEKIGDKLGDKIKGGSSNPLKGLLKF